MREAQIAFNVIFVIAKWAPLVVAHVSAFLIFYRVGKGAWKGTPIEGTSNAAMISAIAAFIWVLSR